MKLAATNADIASAKDRKGQRILQKTPQRALTIVAIYANDTHQIGYDADCHLRPVYLGLDRKLTRGGGLLVDGMTRPPGERACRLYDRLRIRQGKAHCLVFDDRMKSPAPLGSGKVQREVKRCPHQSYAENPN